MTQFWTNVVVWFGGWLGLFCVLEALAVWWPGCPWDTFSRTAWDLQARWDFLTIPVVAILAILASHLIRMGGIAEGDRLPVQEEIRIRKVAKAQEVLEKHA